MDLITGNNRSKFNMYLTYLFNEKARKLVVIILNGLKIRPIIFFTYLPFCMKTGALLDYYDGIGYNVQVEKYSSHEYYVIILGVWSSDEHKNREAAFTEAFIKLDKLLN